MDEPQAQEEHVPECVEVKLAYDLSAIPLLGGLFVPVLYVIALVKLGYRATFHSFWLQKALSHSLKRSWIPLVIIGFLLPIWSESRKPDPSDSVQFMLKIIADAQSTYHATYKRYAPNLATLVQSNFLNMPSLLPCIAPGIESSEPFAGYYFQMTEGRKWTATTFYVRCRPESATAGTNGYSTDATGNIVIIQAY